MEFHFATVWESVADVLADDDALVHGSSRVTWRQYDDRASRMAAAFSAAGLRPDSKLGLYLFNGNEYLESHFGAFKMRAVPVNVNYRYVDEELRYLLDNADAEALVYHSSLGDRVARVKDRLPGVKLWVEVDDGSPGQVPGSVPYETLIAEHDPMPRIAREESDIYMLYTGGTTGMPKGVMYQMGDITRAFVSIGFPIIGRQPPAEAADIPAIVSDAVAAGSRIISLTGAPLMHGTGVWLGAMVPQLGGATVVTLQGRSLDPDEVLTTLQRERCTNLTIVGDAFAKPIIRAIDTAAAAGKPYDLSAMKMIISSGVMWTSEVKEQLLERIEQVWLVDAMGSSEGSMGTSISMKGMPAATARFSPSEGAKVFTDDDREVTPGSGEIGMLASGGMVPVGYFKDPEKSARTFRTINGKRYSFPGDMAMVGEDGSIVLLGRGSQVINSGGEKIFPEEVEEAVKRVDGVIDCLVVGTDDDRFGQVVTAVASLTPGAQVTADDVIASVKGELAHYKAPKHVVFVAEVPRAPNGKADYKTAFNLAVGSLTAD